jgi:hypothetical protein
MLCDCIAVNLPAQPVGGVLCKTGKVVLTPA